MNKNLLILGVAALLIPVVGLSGCNEIIGSKILTDGEKLVGTWTTDSPYDTLTLYSSGKCKKFTYDGTWSIQNGKLVLIYAAGSNPHEYTYGYSFSNNNNTLTLTNIDTGHSLVHTRK